MSLRSLYLFMRLDFDELHVFAEETFAHRENETAEQRRKRIEDETMDFLLDMYLLGFLSTGLPDTREPDPMRIRAVLYQDIAGENIIDRILKHIEEDSAPLFGTLIESEAHRISEQAGRDAAKNCEAAGHRVFKIWNTMLDDKVRDTHEFIQGYRAPIDMPIYTFDGDSAQCPGGFRNVANNAGCRCWLTYETV